MKYKKKYSDKLPECVGGKCYYPWFPLFGTCKVVIRPKHKGDEGLLAHELIHVKQYSKNFWHTLRIKFDKKYRYECEIEAYSKQAEVYGYMLKEQFMWMAEAISLKYELSVDIETVLDKLVENCVLRLKDSGII